MSNSIRSQLYKDFVKQYPCFHSSNIKNNELLYANTQSESNILKNDDEKFLVFLIKNSNLKFFFNLDVQRGGGSTKTDKSGQGEGGGSKNAIFTWTSLMDGPIEVLEKYLQLLSLMTCW